MTNSLRDTVFPPPVQRWVNTLVGDIESINFEFETLPDGVKYDAKGKEWFHYVKGEHVAVTVMEPDQKKHTKVFLFDSNLVWSDITPEHAATCYYELCHAHRAKQIAYDIAILYRERPGD